MKFLLGKLTIFEAVKNCSGLMELFRVMRKIVQVHTFTNCASQICLNIIIPSSTLKQSLHFSFQQKFYVISRVILNGTANQPKVLAATGFRNVFTTVNISLNRMGTD
jgi:hypothetical protein